MLDPEQIEKSSAINNQGKFLVLAPPNTVWPLEKLDPGGGGLALPVPQKAKPEFGRNCDEFRRWIRLDRR